ncbi:hypothetical protein Gorai_004694 [Gossypium raimondii]|uniref:Uncharacterized protein n=1 Tax=Gossypium raimondii TaxID=29730 RepID=A0A7J8QJS7_GOSRA|nr:hypothetical protein [Gossypium raimondii]
MVSKWMFLMDKKVSFKEELIGSVPKTQTVREDENSELFEGDVITEAVDGVPSIHFLDRFNWFIERRMILSVIIKLLGRKIGFPTSVNKVQGLPEGLYNQYLLKAIGEMIGPFGHNKDFRSHHPFAKTKECEMNEQPKSKTDEIHKRVEEERFGKNEGEDDSVGLIDAEKFVARMEGNLPRTDSTSIEGKSS